MQEMSKRNKYFTDSVIRRMTRIAIEHNSINLAQGFPDFDPPKELTDRLKEISSIGPHQYPITMGALNFRKAACKKSSHFMNIPLDAEKNIVVTIGSTEAMVDTIFALTNPKDKIIMFSPYFENYKAQCIMADCEPIFVDLEPPVYTFDPNKLEDAFKKGAKAIIICNPSNPSGRVFTRKEMEMIASLCIKYDTYAITDEVYEHIIFEGREMVYMSAIPNMWERTIAISSLSKTYSITGWRLGYAIAEESIMDKIKQYHDFNAVGAASPLMEAAVKGLEMGDSYYKEFGKHYHKLKEIFTNGLKSLNIPFREPEGTYFVLADFSAYMKKNEDDIAFCEKVAKEIGVAFVPGSSFFTNHPHGVLRLHFAKKEETLFEALNRLEKLKKL